MTASISPSEDESCQMYSAGWPRLRLMAYHASWSQLLPGKTITPNFMSLAVGEVTLQFSRGGRAAKFTITPTAVLSNNLIWYAVFLGLDEHCPAHRRPLCGLRRQPGFSHLNGAWLGDR